MAPTSSICMKCKLAIQGKDALGCSSCHAKYDLLCASVTTKRFHLMDKQQKNSWKCMQCRNKQSITDYPTICSGTSSPITPTIKDDSDANITMRTKQKLGPSVTESDGYVTEARLREILKQELKVSIKELVTNELKHIVGQIHDFREAMNYFNQHYEDIKASLTQSNTIIADLQKDNENLKSTVKDLTGKLHLIEQHMRQNNIEVNGIPEHKSEKLITTMGQLLKTVKCGVNSDDILYVSRVAKFNKENPKPRSVIVKLRSPRQRDEVLDAVIKYNKTNSHEKLNTQHLGIGGPRTPVYVSEHLSPSNKALHAAARIKAKEMSYKFTWVRNGHIYVRKNESSQALLI
ncbi:hypothetical protein O3G_MSEX000449, partial [Manduca sexta]